MNTATLIIGAGISGLSAAFTLHQAGQSVIVLDAAPQVGGLIQSEWESGFLMESGPHTIPASAKELLAMAKQVGLTPKLTHPQAKKRYLLHQNRLIALPGNPLEAITTPLLSPIGKWRLLNEPFQPKTDFEDISIATWIQRRLGPEVLNHMIDPLVSGIYAGDVNALSLPAVFPKLWAWEQEYGSILKGILKSRKPPTLILPRKGGGDFSEQFTNNLYSNESHYEMKSTKHLYDVKSPPPLRRRARVGGKALLSFEGGLSTFCKALQQALPPETVQLGQVVTHIEATDSGYRVLTQTGQSWTTRSIILATPAPIAAQWLESIAPLASQALAQIPYNSLGISQMGFPKKDFPHPLDGFGCLIPREESYPLLGVIWSSSLFPERTPEDMVLLTALTGGAHHPEVRNWSEDQVRHANLSDLQSIFKAPLTPVYDRSWVVKQAIPQYTLGHLQRIKQIETALQHHPNIRLCGNYLHGVALNHCVQSGQRAAEDLLMASYPE